MLEVSDERLAELIEHHAYHASVCERTAAEAPMSAERLLIEAEVTRELEAVCRELQGLRRFRDEMHIRATVDGLDCDSKVNVKLVTVDRAGCQFVEPVAVEREDDGSMTVVVEAWREP